MAHDLTETAAWQATVQVPDDGDAAVAASLYGTAGTGFQALANRLAYLRATALNGHLVGASKVEVLNPAGPVDVSQIHMLILGGAFLTSAATTVPLPGGITAGVLWCLYALDNAGTIDWEWSTDGPDSSGRFKLTGGVTVDTTRRYITTIAGSGAGTAHPQVKADAVVLYLPDADGTADGAQHIVLGAHGAGGGAALGAGGTSTVGATFSVLTRVPAHARAVSLHLISYDGTVPGYYWLARDGGTLANGPRTPTLGRQAHQRLLVMPATGLIAYKVTAGSELHAYVAGYHDLA